MFLSRLAIDEACPCAAAAKPGAHVKCAKAVVATRIANGSLDKTCKSEALKHATKSICGRPGAVVCCRVKTNGKTSHKIAKTAGKCTSTATMTACTSAFPSVPTGCDATGCIASVCGNSMIEPGEDCEPPDSAVCDASCHLVTCDPPVTDCGNGTIDAGEACEPPGAGACGWDCQTTTCAAGGPGEIPVACAADDATVGASSRGSDYLLAWNDVALRPDPDIVARRFDPDGVPLDSNAQVVSAGVPCAGKESLPAVGSDAGGYVLSWFGFGPAVESPGLHYFASYARPYDASAALGPLDELVRRTPFGMCPTSLYGPMAVAPLPAAGADAFVALWQDLAACVFGPSVRDPAGLRLEYGVSPTGATPLVIGHEPFGSPPLPLSDGAASVATLGTDTLAVWHSHIMSSTPPHVSGHAVSSAWIAAGGTSTFLALSSRQPGIGIGTLLRPSVAAASDKFLVAWAEGPVDDATEIRGMRVTEPAGPLDPDGGLLLATTTSGAAVVGGPVVAFDGTVWLVTWTEVGVGGNDLRAVAVHTDGTVVDVTPRLVASGLGDAEPAIASAGDGRSLVLYVRPDGGKSAVRAQLVPGL